MIQLIAGVVVVVLLTVAWLIRRDESARADARRRNPKPVYPFDEPYGDL